MDEDESNRRMEELLQYWKKAYGNKKDTNTKASNSANLAYEPTAVLENKGYKKRLSIYDLSKIDFSNH